MSALGFFQPIKAGAREGGLIDLNDKCAQLRRVPVVMRVKNSKLGLDECLRQCVETLGGAEPGEAVGQQANGRPEFTGMTAPNQRIDPGSADKEVDLSQIIEILNCAAINRLHTDRGGPRLQQLQQLQPANGRKANTIDHHALAAMHERNVVPRFHVRRDDRMGVRIVFVQEVERPIGKYDTEAEGGIGSILLEYTDVGIGLPALDQIGKVEAGWTSAQD